MSDVPGAPGAESRIAALLPRSLHGRLVLLLIALLGGVGILLLIGLAHGSRLFFEEVHARLDADVAEHIAHTIHPRPDGGFDEAELKGLFMDVMVINPALEVYLLDTDGALLAYDAPEERILRRHVDLAPVERALSTPAGAEAAEIRVVYGEDPRSRDRRKPIGVAPVEVDGRRVGYVYLILGGQGYDSVLAPLRQSWVIQTAALLAAGMLVVSAAFGVFAVGRLTRPLRALRGRMDAFRSADGDETTSGAGDELAELERTFDAMAARIRAQVAELERNDERRREFVAGISHDLRTPASALQGYLETLVIRADRIPPAERAQYLETTLRQARRLAKLIDQLFELARLEAAGGPEGPGGIVRFESFSLAELVQDTVCEFEGTAARRGITLRAVFPYDLPPVRADIALIQRALDNLIDNALRYAEPGAEVVVRLAEHDGGVGVRVWNAGAPIPAEELPLLFERFHRGSHAPRAASHGGTGLGLAITRRIVALHDASIRVESTPEAGTTFSFVLAAPGRSQKSSPK